MSSRAKGQVDSYFGWYALLDSILLLSATTRWGKMYATSVYIGTHVGAIQINYSK